MRFRWLFILTMVLAVGCQTIEPTLPQEEELAGTIEVVEPEQDLEPKSEFADERGSDVEPELESADEEKSDVELEPEFTDGPEPGPNFKPKPELKPIVETKLKTPAEALDWAKSQLPSNKRLLFSLFDFATKETLSHNGDVVVFPASLIKIHYLAVFLEEVSHGRQSLDTVYTLQEEDKYANEHLVAGAGILKSQPVGSEYTFEELITLMVAQSDNVAANIITNTLGFPLINQQAKEYGLEKTRAQRLMYDSTSPGSNLSTMNDMITLLVSLENREIIDGDLYERAIRIKRIADKKRIGKYVPVGVAVANKLGTTGTIISDMAIIHFLDREPIALAIMVQRRDGEKLDASTYDELIAELAKYIMEYYVGK